MSFVTNRLRPPPPILSPAVVKLQGFNSADSATVTEAMPLATNVVGGTVIAKADSYAVSACSAVIPGPGNGSRAERSCSRGHGVSPVMALILAAAIALSPLADDETQVRQCALFGNGKSAHVVCRFVDPPQLANEHRPQPTPLPPTG
jgi:hypothetical protein